MEANSVIDSIKNQIEELYDLIDGYAKLAAVYRESSDRIYKAFIALCDEHLKLIKKNNDLEGLERFEQIVNTLHLEVTAANASLEAPEGGPRCGICGNPSETVMCAECRSQSV